MHIIKTLSCNKNSWYRVMGEVFGIAKNDSDSKFLKRSFQTTLPCHIFNGRVKSGSLQKLSNYGGRFATFKPDKSFSYYLNYLYQPIPLPLLSHVIENLSFLRVRNSWQFSKKLLYIELVANPQENTVIIANFSNSGKYLFVTDTTLLDFMISTIF